MMWYEGNVKDNYRLAKICEVFPDDKGLVRTVRVQYRKKDIRESKEVYRYKPLTEEKVAVQRLQLISSILEDEEKTEEVKEDQVVEVIVNETDEGFKDDEEVKL